MGQAANVSPLFGVFFIIILGIWVFFAFLQKKQATRMINKSDAQMEMEMQRRRHMQNKKDE